MFEQYDGAAPCGCEKNSGVWFPCKHHTLPEVGEVFEDEAGWRQVVALIDDGLDYGFWAMDPDGDEHFTFIKPPWRNDP